ncbi:MAG: hypothetical protein ACKVXR_18295 [Planctomycetota bacterium]
MISLLLVALIDPSAAQGEFSIQVRAFHQKDDRDGCASLFLAHPAAVLPAIEGFFERALSLREGRRDEDVEPARAQEQLAVWSARVARDALGAPLVADLAASRAGWTESDRRLHREARAVHAKALGAIEKGENRLGLEAGLESTTRSLALGDWRGAAMGHQTAAIAHQALSSLDDALIAWNQARLIFRELGARDEELACQRAVVDMCQATDRFERGREAADQAVSLAQLLGNKKAQSELLERRAGFEEKLGLREAAAATRAAAKALGG